MKKGYRGPFGQPQYEDVSRRSDESAPSAPSAPGQTGTVIAWPDCAYCGRPHPVSAAVAEESPHCRACLHERTELRTDYVKQKASAAFDLWVKTEGRLWPESRFPFIRGFLAGRAELECAVIEACGHVPGTTIEVVAFLKNHLHSLNCELDMTKVAFETWVEADKHDPSE